MYSDAMIPETAVLEGTELNHVIDERPDDPDWVRVAHDTPEPDRAEMGFDLTDFGSSGPFEELLATFDLDPRVTVDGLTPEYAKVDKSPDDPDRDYGVFVWSNENVALITGNNPVTGEYSDPDMRHDETGYASYIGISGHPGAVEELFDAVKQRASHIKEADPTGRQFI